MPAWILRVLRKGGLRDAAFSDLDRMKSKHVPGIYSCNKTEGSFDQPKGRDGADGVSRNVLAPGEGGLRRDVPLTEPLGGEKGLGNKSVHQILFMSVTILSQTK
jgi:hypothetical protein